MIRINKVRLQPGHGIKDEDKDRERWRQLKELGLVDDTGMTLNVILMVEMTGDCKLCVYAFTTAQGVPVYHGPGEEHSECNRVVAYTFAKDGWTYFLYP